MENTQNDTQVTPESVESKWGDSVFGDIYDHDFRDISTDADDPDFYELPEKYKDYTASELLLGKPIKDLFISHPKGQEYVEEAYARIPEGMDAGFYEGVASGLVFAARLLNGLGIDDSDAVGTITTLLLGLEDYTDSQGLDLLYDDEIASMFSPFVEEEQDYESGVQQLAMIMSLADQQQQPESND